MNAWVRTFRPLNLSMIALMMYLMRWCIIKPILYRLGIMMEAEFASYISEGSFALLVLSVVLIAAGGYLVNDIQDVQEDAVNKPGKNPIGQQIPVALAERVYYACTAVGVGLGFGLAISFGNYNYALLHLAAALSLWFYAHYFKSSLLIGNVIVAMCVALVPLTVGIFEVSLLQNGYPEMMKKFKDFNFNFIAWWLIGYAVFAFLLTLAREWIKDMQDVEGDLLSGKITLAGHVGYLLPKILVIAVYALTIGLMVWVNRVYVQDRFTFTYVIGLSLLLIAQSLWLIRANQSGQFRLLSGANKLTSLLGLLYSIGIAYMMYEGQLL